MLEKDSFAWKSRNCKKRNSKSILTNKKRRN